ncbi:hypothetical protein [Alkalihalobacillus trypoxylicola]|uniref:hypothetical protein n=1 Tax=Alkalihalobacillus trypoxylicola TaxID=519424 RepID=UPI000A94A47B|nr:hypothetical protein [Alkalihalobacillus trypoxylicola]
MNRLQNVIISLLTVMVLWISMGETTHAQNPPSYNYSFWEESVPAPAAYEAINLIDGESLGVGALNEPNDLHITRDGQVFILDSGNNRIIHLDEHYNLVEVMDAFQLDGVTQNFSNPQGIFVNDDGHIFVADTGNNRVIHFDETYHVVKMIDEPESELLNDSFTFLPVKVVVDYAERVFVMADGVFDGFMEFSIEGDFTTFIGANRVRVDPIEYLWKRFATREQRSQMVMYVPTEFTSLDIDEKGFIYATSADNSDDMIKKLNARGDDILRREGYFSPRGDIRYTQSAGPSRMIDISVADHEIYSVLDARRGRIFTYNGDGHLMYVFGSIGNKVGQFHTPIAIERNADQFLVLDRALGEVTIFSTTEYGQILNEAVKSYETGNEERAHQLFAEAVNMNVNLEFAYTGIGKALLRQDEFEGAIDHFIQSMDRANYSKAYQLHRNQTLREHFSTVMTVAIVTIGGLTIFSIFRKRRLKKRGVSIE